MQEPERPPGDDKDWTVVITDGCDQCQFTPACPGQLPGRIRESADFWYDALRRPGADERLRPRVWSPLEYACHVRDLAVVFSDRLQLILAEDDPLLPNFDGDEAAIERRYWAQDPNQVADEYASATEKIAQQFLGIGPDEWGRRGRRTDGVAFTLASLGTYFLHELDHHAHDVRQLQGRASR